MQQKVKIPEGTEEERKMYLELAKKFGLKIEEEEVKPKATDKRKVLKVVMLCGLCKTRNEEYIELVKYTDGVWKNERTLTKEEADEIGDIEVQEDRVPCCCCCVDFLMAKDKMELVLMITKMRARKYYKI